MEDILSLIIGLSFTALLFRAVCETFFGTCMLVFGLALYALAAVLDVCGWCVEILSKR